MVSLLIMAALGGNIPKTFINKKQKLHLSVAFIKYFYSSVGFPKLHITHPTPTALAETP